MLYYHPFYMLQFSRFKFKFIFEIILLTHIILGLFIHLYICMISKRHSILFTFFVTPKWRHIIEI
ncbi:hypothetical protein HanIR_Chr05g0221351 [Helianthus annuus]|nr:hypothetical protein HanIR_Chr05g0221351 [Helianthus annuus]